jgi:hypothetical protein
VRLRLVWLLVCKISTENWVQVKRNAATRFTNFIKESLWGHSRLKEAWGRGRW